MEKVRIFFGDLTYDTVGLATGSIPLNIGYVAAYCAKQHRDSLAEIRLFKYISDLENAIEKDPPDILALSNYMWCHNLGREIFSTLSRRRPESLRVMGGPLFPHHKASQERYLAERPWLDAYIYLEGEVGFSRFIEFVLTCHDLKGAREQLNRTRLPGCALLNADGKFSLPAEAARLKNLDEIPSPYLNGMLDPFFDGRLVPILSTNRGCPFHCTFCHDGTDAVNKINSFGLERVRDEINYIAERVPKTIGRLLISDLNFGMYKRDLEICHYLAEVQRKWNYPLEIETTTGKNAKDKVIAAVESLGNTIHLSLSVQSMTEQVLNNVKRENIRTKDIIGLQAAIQRANLPTISEIILGLPGETLASHYATVGELLDGNVDLIVCYNLILLTGSELDEPHERSKWGLKTKFRAASKDFARLRSGKIVMEIEEVVVGSDALSFADYLAGRKMALLTRVVNCPGFKPLLKVFHREDWKILPFFQAIFTDVMAGNGIVTILFQQFEENTVSELWDSPEEIRAYFRREENFHQLLVGRLGRNLLQIYGDEIFLRAMPQLLDIVFDRAEIYFGARQTAFGPISISALKARCEEECRVVSANYARTSRRPCPLPRAVERITL